MDTCARSIKFRIQAYSGLGCIEVSLNFRLNSSRLTPSHICLLRLQNFEVEKCSQTRTDIFESEPRGLNQTIYSETIFRVVVE